MKSLSDLLVLAKKKGKKRLVVVAPEEEYIYKAVEKAAQENIIIPVFVGDEQKINQIAGESDFELKNSYIIHISDKREAARKATELIRAGDADILMKGTLGTSTLLKAILDKEKGIRNAELLNHLAFIESPYYHKVFAVSDVAMNIYPTLEEKKTIIENSLKVLVSLGIINPKVAIAAALEKENPNIEATIHAAKLKQMNLDGKISNCIIDGPLAIDNIFLKSAAEIKGIKSVIPGDVDMIIMPDINSGNIFYKSLNFLGGASSAAVIIGAQAPVVLTSRADSEKSKFMSIVLSVAM